MIKLKFLFLEEAREEKVVLIDPKTTTLNYIANISADKSYDSYLQILNSNSHQSESIVENIWNDIKNIQAEDILKIVITNINDENMFEIENISLITHVKSFLTSGVKTEINFIEKK